VSAFAVGVGVRVEVAGTVVGAVGAAVDAAAAAVGIAASAAAFDAAVFVVEVVECVVAGKRENSDAYGRPPRGKLYPSSQGEVVVPYRLGSGT
jgi:type IV secretory pathway TrbL component